MKDQSVVALLEANRAILAKNNVLCEAVKHYAEQARRLEWQAASHKFDADFWRLRLASYISSGLLWLWR